MPFVPFPNSVQVNLNWTLLGQQAQNTLYFTREDEVNESIMIGLAESIIEKLVDDVMPNMPIGLTLREVSVIDLSSAIAPAVTVTTGLPVTGPVNEEAVPNNVTLTMSFRTSGRGRSSRGRNYLVGMRESQVANNTVSGPFVALWSGFYEFLLTGPIPEGWVWVVASRIANGVERTEGVVNFVTSFLVVDTTVDSQRRRLPGRGT